MTKRLRASLAWGLGFFVLAIAILNLTFIVVTEVSRTVVIIGAIFTAGMISLLYYGASLLFFREGSFFREKMTVLYFIIVFLAQTVSALIAPPERIAEYARTPSLGLIGITYMLIAILFYQVSRRLPEDDPRRKTTVLVSVAWIIVFIANIYLALFFGEYPTIETFALLLGTVGFILLVYGMTTGKTTRK